MLLTAGDLSFHLCSFYLLLAVTLIFILLFYIVLFGLLLGFYCIYYCFNPACSILWKGRVQMPQTHKRFAN